MMIKLLGRLPLGVVSILAVSGVLFLSSDIASARVGVGMGAGEIRLTSSVKPGGIYTLPKLRIFNTGDETTTYGLDVAYHAERPELRPGQDWFSFSPSTFTLPAGESQEISVTMTVPVKAEQGDYFAFLESGPIASDNSGGTTVGVAVASKLFFTVAPANLFQAILYRVSSFFNTYAPWSWVGLAVVLLTLSVLLFRRFFHFHIHIAVKEKKVKGNTVEEQ